MERDSDNVQHNKAKLRSGLNLFAEGMAGLQESPAGRREVSKIMALMMQGFAGQMAGASDGDSLFADLAAAIED